MKYRTLGSTGLSVSVVGVGTWQFGGEWGRDYTPADADAILDAARAHGINLVDTAECYGDHLSERLVGGAIAPDRDRWVVATKFGHRFNAPFDRDNRFDPASVRTQLEDSLRALGTDRVELYQFHSGDDRAFDHDELWTTLDQLRQAGKVLHLGVSIGSNTNTHQTAAAPRVGAEAIQVVYNRLDRAPEDAVFGLCREHRLGVLARVPLASGYLSGKYTPESRFSDRDVRGRWHSAAKRREAIEAAQRIQREEVPPGTDMAQWALAWCLQHPAVTCVIPGCKDPQQVHANARAASLAELVRDDHPQAAEAPAGLRSV